MTSDLQVFEVGFTMVLCTGFKRYEHPPTLVPKAGDMGVWAVPEVNSLKRPIVDSLLSV